MASCHQKSGFADAVSAIIQDFNNWFGLFAPYIAFTFWLMDLTHPVFSYGQLYTVFSRVRNREHVLILLPTDDPNTRNVTYPEFLS